MRKRQDFQNRTMNDIKKGNCENHFFSFANAKRSLNARVNGSSKKVRVKMFNNKTKIRQSTNQRKVRADPLSGEQNKFNVGRGKLNGKWT